jgi:hypothetical protein
MIGLGVMERSLSPDMANHGFSAALRVMGK